MASKIGRLHVNKSILLLCDMQEKFAKSISHFNEIVQNSGRLVDVANHIDLQSIATEHYPKGLGHTVPQLKHKFKDTVIFDKTLFSMCTKDLLGHINKTKPEFESVILCGIEAHACVLSTCLDLLAAGKDVHVAVDAVSSRSLVDRKYAFKRMAQSGAFLTTTESLVFQLLKDAKHAKFKDIQKLIMTPTPDTSLLKM